VIVIKRGKDGAAVFTEGRRFIAETEKLLPLDSTGAGDAFAGAFLAARIRGSPPAECAALGNKAARELLKARSNR
jgi:sugar/nucleoside kinase (ribokinase family)